MTAQSTGQLVEVAQTLVADHKYRDTAKETTGVGKIAPGSMSLVAEAPCNHIISVSVSLFSPCCRKEYTKVGSSCPLGVDWHKEYHTCNAAVSKYFTAIVCYLMLFCTIRQSFISF